MHERISVNNLCFPGTPFAELVNHWRTLAPRRVGLTTHSILEEGPDIAKMALATGNYDVAVFSHQFLAGDLEPREETWIQPRERLLKVIEIGKALGTKTIYMVTGGHGFATWEEAAQNFSAAIAPCLAPARAAGIELLVESSPPLYAHSHIAHNLRDTLTLAEMAGIGVCVDIFAIWTEAGLKQTIERAMPRCHLIQVADYVLGDNAYPCRAVPGDGVIPLKRIFDWALSAGYAGSFDLELIGPRIAKEGRVAAVGRAADHVGELLGSLGA